MKKMKSEINYKGKEYSLVFNLNVMEEIQDEYKSLEAWGKACPSRPFYHHPVRSFNRQFHRRSHR